MSRYEQLNSIIRQLKPQTIVEIGTWNGDRAVQMARKALKFSETGRVMYMGFDLFEDATDETDERELNVKQHFSFDAVVAKLDALKAENPNFEFTLVRGDTRETLAGQNLEADLVFMDGGHSVETIASDFEAVKNAKAIVLDDFYVPDEQGRCPDITKFGCNQLLEDIPRAFSFDIDQTITMWKRARESKDFSTADQIRSELLACNIVPEARGDGSVSWRTGDKGPRRLAWTVLPAADPVRDGGLVQMVCLGFEPVVEPKNLQVKTKNSISDVMLARNIGYSTSKGFREIETCRIHDLRAVMVSGGPSYKDSLNDIRKMAKSKKNRIVCVKTSHDTLIAEGIIPWACVLLDPRPHVLDYVANPHPDVLYITASQVSPKTIDRLVSAKAKVLMYHALVGDFMKEILEDAGYILGGSTAATRGVMVLGAMGFRKYTLYGYDSCYADNSPRKGLRGQDIEPIEVTANGKAFWTDAELVAQAQDFEFFKTVDIDLDVKGDGMIPHIWHQVAPKKADLADLLADG